MSERWLLVIGLAVVLLGVMAWAAYVLLPGNGR